jgi:hypothetical protein
VGIPEISFAMLQIPMIQSWIILNALCDTLLLGLDQSKVKNTRKVNPLQSLAKSAEGK